MGKGLTVLVAVALVLTVTAAASGRVQRLITGRDIENNTVASADIKNNTIVRKDLNRRLVASLRLLAPQATIVMTGEEKSDAEDLLRAGADEVLVPGEIIGERVLELLRKEA